MLVTFDTDKLKRIPFVLFVVSIPILINELWPAEPKLRWIVRVTQFAGAFIGIAIVLGKCIRFTNGVDTASPEKNN